MNILHISDLHFGPRHWDGNYQLLLEKINSFNADIVLNTGDNTTDGLESEYVQAGKAGVIMNLIQFKNYSPARVQINGYNRRTKLLTQALS